MINNADRVRGCVYGVGALLMLISGTACAQYATTVQTVTGPVADWPAATIAAAAPNKIVGGGARTNWTTFGNLLTQSSPGLPGQNAWVGAGKDHSVAEPTTLTVFGIALNDPNDDWDVGVFTANSGMSPRPVVTAYLPDGFALTGGGCTVNWQASAPAPAGNLLTGSFPSSLKSWECRSKDHSVADPSTITAYVIGIRPKRAGLALPAVQITTATTGPTARPYVIVPGIPGAVVTGGGALALPADPADAGQLLTGTYPATAAGFAGPLGWFASSKDHTAVSPGTVTAFAVNLSFAGPGTALALTSSGSPQALWPLSVIGAGTFQNPNSVPVALTAVGFDGIGPGQRMVSVDPATTCLTTAPLPPAGSVRSCWTCRLPPARPRITRPVHTSERQQEPATTPTLPGRHRLQLAPTEPATPVRDADILSQLLIGAEKGLRAHRFRRTRRRFGWIAVTQLATAPNRRGLFNEGFPESLEFICGKFDRSLVITRRSECLKPVRGNAA